MKGDTESITVYAFRYCLGRQTYAVQDCVEFLKMNWSDLSRPTQGLIRKEIMAAFDGNRYGAESDRALWAEVLDLGSTRPAE